MSTKNNSTLLPVISCLIAATLWGVFWYPLRVLEGMGLPGLWTTLIIYVSAFMPLWPYFWKQKQGLRSHAFPFVLLGLFAGWTNLSFILAMLEGHVVRVLLLFYLSPIWTLIFGFIFLHERLSIMARVSLLISFIGALVILWPAESNTLFQFSKVDLLAVSSGIAFAAHNVVVRKIGDVPIILKMGSAWIGVLVLTIIGLFLSHASPPEFSGASLALALLVGSVGMVLMTYTALYGVTHLPVHRSAAIMLFEVFAGAVSAALLTEEILTLREWTGGLLIMFAAWLTIRDLMNNPAT
jgi:drug/metabolite transporter (DMT)-like permease